MIRIQSICLLFVVAVIAIGSAPAKRVTQAEAISAATNKVNPEYPPLARQLKLSGAVELDVTIGAEGTVESVDIVSGNPVLTRPAADAMKRWKFKPFTSDGVATRVSALFSFNFKP